jgi:hypothetical protein
MDVKCNNRRMHPQQLLEPRLAMWAFHALRDFLMLPLSREEKQWLDT